MIIKTTSSINDIRTPYDDESQYLLKKEIELAQSHFTDFIEYMFNQ